MSAAQSRNSFAARTGMRNKVFWSVWSLLWPLDSTSSWPYCVQCMVKWVNHVLGLSHLTREEEQVKQLGEDLVWRHEGLLLYQLACTLANITSPPDVHKGTSLDSLLSFQVVHKAHIFHTHTSETVGLVEASIEIFRKEKVSLITGGKFSLTPSISYLS